MVKMLITEKVTLQIVSQRLMGGDYLGALKALQPLAAGNPHKKPLVLYAEAMAAYQLHDSPGDKGDAMECSLRLLERAALVTESSEPYPGFSIEVHYNLGMVLRHFGRHEEASAMFAYVLQRRPDYLVAWAEFGGVEAALGNMAEARRMLRRALQLPLTSYADGMAKAHAAGLLGEHEHFWWFHEMRLRNPLVRGLLPDVPERMQRWTGEDDVGLLVFGEQGFGDAIQMLRYLPGLMARFPAIALAVRAPLRPMVAQMYPMLRLLAEGDDWPEDLTHYVSLMSLTARLGWPPPAEAYIPRDARTPNGEQASRFRVAYAHAGSRSHRNDRLRSSPIEVWQPLFDLPGVEWVVPPSDGGFEATRQMLSDVDAVVTVDTSLAHLAGAMGIPTAVLLSANPDARWSMEGTTTPWYPSWHLCRQPVLGDWPGAVTQAVEWLRAV